jgi:hypothetical protein
MNIVNIHRHCIDTHNSTKLDQNTDTEMLSSWLYLLWFDHFLLLYKQSTGFNIIICIW